MSFSTMKKIQSVTVGSGGAANIEFTNIPETFDDLVILGSIRSSRTNNFGTISFNSSSANFSSRRLEGNGTTATSATRTDNLAIFINSSAYTASTFANAVIYIPNYRGSTNKSVSIDAVTENNATESIQCFTAMLWSNTAAITSITLGESSPHTFVQHSTAVLYGIKKS